MIKFYSQEAFHADPSTHLFKSWGMKEVDNSYDADLVIFNGGRDIGTEIYGEEPVFAGIPRSKSTRDLIEINLYTEVRKAGQFALGICRGAQLLNCLNGGSLWQHVDNHNNDHDILDLITGKRYYSTSVHHQMMRPNLQAGQLIAVASQSNNKHSMLTHEHIAGTPALKDGQDAEIVYYAGTRTLCVQGHPEYNPGSPFADYIKYLVVNLMAGGELHKALS